MKSVPPSACSNLPLRCLTAEVKAPRSWPNSSLSISSEGMAAQLTSTNGAAARTLLACSQRATSSFPVPFSPVISTRASHGATLSISWRTCSISGETPMIRSAWAECARRRRTGGAAGGACAGAGLSMVRCSDCSSRFMSMGFVRKSCAPLRTALTAVSIDVSAERAMNGMPASGTLHSVSDRITSNGILSHNAEAAASFSTASAENPSYSNRSRRMFRTLFDWSRIKTFVIALFFRNFTYFCPKVMIFRRVKRIPEVSLRGAESEKNDL